MTRDELIARRNFVGSSDVSTILGLNKYANIVDLWLEKTGQTEPDESTNLAASLGTHLEAGLCALYAQEYKVEIVRGETFKHSEHDFMAAQLDGLILGDLNEHLEIKTAGLINPRFNGDEWGEPNTDRIPLAYLVQCQFALMCTGLNRVNLYALLGNNRLNRYIIDRNERLHGEILERVLKFWDDVHNRRRPSDDVPSIDTLKRVYREPAKITPIDESFVEEYQSLKAQESLIKAAVENKKAEIIDSLGDAEVGVSPFGEFHYSANVRGVRSLTLRNVNK